MSLPLHLDWPFFDAHHRQWAQALACWADETLAGFPVNIASEALDACCKNLVQQLGQAGWLRADIHRKDFDIRAEALAREILAERHPLADFAFAMQGLGSAALVLEGTTAQREAYLPAITEGKAVAAFALSEPGAGSDAAALTTTARRDGDGWVLEGEKTWVSNGGIADLYTLFARTGEEGARGISAFVVEAGTAGLRIAERLSTASPHPMARLELDGCKVSTHQLIGQEHQGFALAMRILDRFRPTVGAAALGLARAALSATLIHVQQRAMFGRRLADMQMTQATLADMASQIDAAALLTYRAAWLSDQGKKATKEAAMAKMHATESAAQIIDQAVQLLGASGVMTGNRLEALTRAVRPLRIYEGATEVQKLIIARELLNPRP